MIRPLIGCQLPGGKFILLERFWFGDHFAPAGFITDFDSVPRIPIAYTLLKGRTIYSAAIHDFLYASGFNRKEADTVFLRLMEMERVKRRYRLPIWAAVRLFGWVKYKKHRRRFNPWESLAFAE